MADITVSEELLAAALDVVLSRSTPWQTMVDKDKLDALHARLLEIMRGDAPGALAEQFRELDRLQEHFANQRFEAASHPGTPVRR